MNLLVNSSSLNAALAAQQMAAELPSDVYECSSADTAQVFFGGTGAANGAGTYMMSLWYFLGAGDVNPTTGASYAGAFIPVVIATGAMTLGTLAYGSEGLIMGPATNLHCDTITETSSSPRARVCSFANNAIAFMEVDLLGAVAFDVQTKRGTITAVDVVVQTDARMVVGDLA